MTGSEGAAEDMTGGKGEPGAEGAGRDEDAVSRFVERFAAEMTEMTEAGMQRMAARVFAPLLAADDASMTSAELGRQLRIGPAAVSGAINYLSQVRMVGRERDPGSRRDRYRLHDEIWYATFADRDGADPVGAHPAGRRTLPG
ncbi:hypothetical protein JOC24_001090 [Streptomyces sp. HB132]|nr:hypothetical protein [Streptomyces sp. HB132]